MDENKKPVQNGFGTVLNVISNVLLVIAFISFFFYMREDNVPEWINLIGINPMILPIIYSVLIAVAIKVPAKIILLLADIEYNTRDV